MFYIFIRFKRSTCQCTQLLKFCLLPATGQISRLNNVTNQVNLPRTQLVMLCFLSIRGAQDNFVAYTMQAEEQANLDRITEMKSKSEVILHRI